MSRYLSFLFQTRKRRTVLLGIPCSALIIYLGLASTLSHAGIVDLADSVKEMIVGKSDAPLTIVEYASLGCSHCAKFHHETYPKLKKEFIDTGKVKLKFRDFPLGTPALAAAMIARCSGPARYFGFVDIFFRSQSQWTQTKNPLKSLTKVAHFGGMLPADVNACIGNQNLLEYIQKQKQMAYEQAGVNSTPYFIIGTKKISGGIPYEQFKKIVESELEKVR